MPGASASSESESSPLASQKMRLRPFSYFLTDPPRHQLDKRLIDPGLYRSLWWPLRSLIKQPFFHSHRKRQRKDGLHLSLSIGFMLRSLSVKCLRYSPLKLSCYASFFHSSGDNKDLLLAFNEGFLSIFSKARSQSGPYPLFYKRKKSSRWGTSWTSRWIFTHSKSKTKTYRYRQTLECLSRALSPLPFL